MVLPIEEQRKIYSYLVGSFREKTPYISPLPKEVRGKEDTASSFNIFPKDDKLLWKDYGGGGISGDVWDLLIILRGEVNNYYEAVDFYNKRIKNRSIVMDEVLEQSTVSSKHIKKSNYPVPEYTDQLEPFELKFWNRIGINEDLLILKRIYVLINIRWGSSGITVGSEKGSPAFVWDLSEAGDMSSWKAYWPYKNPKNNEKKWMMWGITNVPAEGYHILPSTGENLIITSGYKDGLVTESCLDNTYCINPTAEGSWKKLLNIVPDLNKRFKNIGIIFDGDSAGLKASKDFSEASGWDAFTLDYPRLPLKQQVIKKRTTTKDITEVVEFYNYNLLKVLFNKKKLI